MISTPLLDYTIGEIIELYNIIYVYISVFGMRNDSWIGSRRFILE